MGKPLWGAHNVQKKWGINIVKCFLKGGEEGTTSTGSAALRSWPF